VSGRRARRRLVGALALLGVAATARAGPPFATDDPTPTGLGGYEIYAFAAGTSARDGTERIAGIDFNYGAAQDLQLTAVVPFERAAPRDGPRNQGVAQVELAAKLRFLHQEASGVDAAFFPRVFLPSASPDVGEQRASLLLPLWLGWSNDDWSIFGGGGYTIHRGAGARNFASTGIAVMGHMTPDFQVGVEVFHQEADSRDTRSSTSVGLGALWDLGAHWHVLASAGPGVQHAADTARTTGYVAVLLTL
jgi:hypothetical protein